MKKDRRRFIAEDGSIKSKEEWLLETDGSNLKEILSNELIDYRRTFTNNCIEMQENLGIEAAR
jgi:DNA-directed RNA polymerase II subunit RPB1